MNIFVKQISYKIDFESKIKTNIKILIKIYLLSYKQFKFTFNIKITLMRRE